jgi:hypothetical protein
MVKLKGNFEADWIAHLRAHLTQVQGWDANEVASLDDSEIPSNFFEGLRRKLAPQARVLKVADDFQCSPTESTGWNALQDKVRMGEDLNPHLSNRHASLFNNDGLLAEWGVHHFHLGTKPDPKIPPTWKGRGRLSMRWSTIKHFAQSIFIRMGAGKKSASLRVFTETGPI